MTIEATATRQTMSWGDDELGLELEWSDDTPVGIASLLLRGVAHRVRRVPLVEILAVGAGHDPASYRLTHTAMGRAQRLVDVDEREEVDGTRLLVVRQEGAGVRTQLQLQRPTADAAFRARVVVENVGEQPLALRAVASFAMGFAHAEGDDDALAGWSLTHARSDWLGESRWRSTALRPDALPRIAEHLTGHDPRGAIVSRSTGTWSTAAELPTAVLHSDRELAIAWQIEHNGPWTWEVGEDTDGGRLALAGPTDRDAAWTRVLAPGASFTSVPAGIAIGASVERSVAALTAYRRAMRRAHVDNAAMPVVFNDYMNTLDGDPTTERLLPLVAGAADVGAEIFCIDAGWYDDSGDWWDTVGLWQPSTTRFPGGLGEVIEAIHAAGMTPGLWLEPEVVGVRSPVADLLPHAAFLQRHGQRLVEHDRYLLDLRHPAATAHLDGVIDGLVERFGIGFFKFDYNVDPGPGTDLDADSVGDGLLRHSRAHLDWLDRLLDRHPTLVVENCASGAMRMDAALLSRLALQSTSDQQDFARYPAIAASAPMSMVPEQAASWAYPQPEMDDEESAFALVTGLLGRFYVSGHLNRMDERQRSRVAEAIRVAKSLRSEIARAMPLWPLGLPGWEDDWVCLALEVPDGALVSAWRRGGDRERRLSLPHLRGRRVSIEPVFPVDLPQWGTEWDADAGTLVVRASDARLGARLLRVAATPASEPRPRIIRHRDPNGSNPEGAQQ